MVGLDGEQALYDETTTYLHHAYNRALDNRPAVRLATGVFQRRLASSTPVESRERPSRDEAGRPCSFRNSWIATSRCSRRRGSRARCATTKAEIADTLGLSRDALSRTARIRATKTQTRLREMVEILHRVEGYTGSPPLVAYAWFRSEALPGFAGLTPDQLVRQGKADLVHAHLDRIMAGGYA